MRVEVSIVVLVVRNGEFKFKKLDTSREIKQRDRVRSMRGRISCEFE